METKVVEGRRSNKLHNHNIGSEICVTPEKSVFFTHRALPAVALNNYLDLRSC